MGDLKNIEFKINIIYSILKIKMGDDEQWM